MNRAERQWLILILGILLAFAVRFTLPFGWWGMIPAGMVYLLWMTIALALFDAL